MKEVFISYASEQIEVARRLCDLLESNGMSAFVAERDIPAGKEYAAEIINALDNAKAMLLILSEASNASPHVLREVERAVGHNVPIIVYAYEEVTLNKSMEYFLMTNQWLRKSENRDALLLEDMKALTSAKTSEALVSATIADALARTEDAAAEQLEKTAPKKQKKGLIIGLAAGALALIAIVVTLLVLWNKGLLGTGGGFDDPGTPDIVDPIELGYHLGDTIELGTYNDEKIVWRLIHINGDGTGVFLSDKILTFKSYDAAEGGAHNDYDGVDYYSFENTFVTDPELLVKIRGNNEWAKCNLRTWLNSDSMVVTYEDQAPDKKAVCQGQNAYDKEPGFLSRFTMEEKEAIVESCRWTKGNLLSEDMDEDGMVFSFEKVFLLSVEELQWLYEAGMTTYAEPTEKAKEKDEGNNMGSLEYLNTTTIDWWLRDPGWDHRIAQWRPELEDGLDSPNLGTVASGDYRDEVTYADRDCSVAVSCYGTRPAITIDFTKLPQESQ